MMGVGQRVFSLSFWFFFIYDYFSQFAAPDELRQESHTVVHKVA